MESERQFRAMFENHRSVMLLIDPDTGAIVRANKSAENYYGFLTENFSGMTIHRINQLPKEKIAEAMAKAKAEKYNCFYFSHRLESGEIRNVEVHSSPIPFRGQMVLFSIVHDITQRKQAEEALKKSEEHLRLITDNLPALISHVDRELNCLFANKAYLTYCGFKPEELIGKKVNEVLDKDAFNRAYPYIQKALKGEYVSMQNHLTREDGQNISFQVNFVPHFEANEITGYFVLGWDITDRKRAEAALQKSLAEKEVLLREIHHRVKNNMQTIAGLLRMHARKINDAQLTEIFADCRDRIGAISLIHEALYQSENLAEIDFNAYLKKLCRNLAQAHDAPRRRIDLTASAADVSLNMDQGVAVGMIIAELISNTFKHAFPHNEGGTVTAHMDRPDGGTVRLVVSDTGIGLPEDFDIRNPSSLGMRLVSGAVTRELGGSIEVERDNGTRFIIRFNCEIDTTF
jgi:PAS domain S-box-containing protein